MDTLEKRRIGKASRKAGKKFENDVQRDLEYQGWIVTRWNKKVENGVLINCKAKFNPFTRSLMMMSGGFPDLLCLKKTNNIFEIKLVECKLHGRIDKVEKEQIRIYSTLGFNIEIASKDQDGRIQYKQALVDS